MKPSQDHNLQPPNAGATQPTPMQLVRGLEPATRHALMHGTRRRILRALGEGPAPRTTKDLLTTFPGLSLGALNYHVLVLEDCGALTVSHVEPVRGTVARWFVSNVAEDAKCVAALRATEQLDEVH